MNSGENTPDPSQFDGLFVRTQSFAPRHREILEAAAGLIAEKGYAGASLRELARRVGLRQPSLYHYFESKEQLVEQVIEAYAGDMFVQHEELPDDFADVPEAIVRMVDRIWDRKSHRLFVRVAVAVGQIEERFGQRLREIFEERNMVAQRFLAAHYKQRGEPFSEEEMIHIMRMTVSALGFRRMEFQVFYDERPVDASYRRYADGVARTMRDYIELRRTTRRQSEG